jgi:hypothetical protein
LCEIIGLFLSLFGKSVLLLSILIVRTAK